MATYNVSTVADLIAKIKLANSNPDNDVINLAAGTYDLSTYSGNRDTDPDFKSLGGTLVNGLPLIKTDITLVGASAHNSIITRNGSTLFRLLHVATGGKLTLRKLTLTKGDVGTADVGGGAVEVFGTANADIEDCRLGPSNKSNYGGAVVNAGSGTVNIVRCDIYDNEADWGGGVYNYQSGTMNLTNTRVANNKAITNGGGWYYAGGVYNANIMTIDHCCIVNNQAQYGGGVVSNRVQAQTTIKRSIISKNIAQEGGGVFSGFGPITVEDSTLMDNGDWSGRVAFRRDAQMITLNRCHLPDNYVEIPAQSAVYPNDLWYVTNQNPLPAWRPEFIMIADGSGGLVPIYQYNRAAAANRAIELSRENFLSFPQDSAASVVGKIENGSASRGRDYGTVLNHVTPPTPPQPGVVGKTGSSIFISEMIHFGGLPMTIDAGDNPTNPDCTNTDQTTTGAFNVRGWRHCPPELSATANWKDHLGILAYFGAFALPNSAKIGEILRTPNVDKSIWIDNNPGLVGGTLRNDEGQVNIDARNAIMNLFAPSGALSSLSIGDYVFVTVQGGSHGFIVVGWGPFLGTIEGIDHALTNTLGTVRSATNTIPYIADFCYGTNSSTSPNPNDTGWLQDPRPRPFYASATEVIGDTTPGGRLRTDQFNYLRRLSPFGNLVPVYQPFKVDTQNIIAKWEFYKLPDSIAINSSTLPLDRLYFKG